MRVSEPFWNGGPTRDRADTIRNVPCGFRQELPGPSWNCPSGGRAREHSDRSFRPLSRPSRTILERSSERLQGYRSGGASVGSRRPPQPVRSKGVPQRREGTRRERPRGLPALPPREVRSEMVLQQWTGTRRERLRGYCERAPEGNRSKMVPEHTREPRPRREQRARSGRVSALEGCVANCRGRGRDQGRMRTGAHAGSVRVPSEPGSLAWNHAPAERPERLSTHEQCSPEKVVRPAVAGDDRRSRTTGAESHRRPESAWSSASPSFGSARRNPTSSQRTFSDSDRSKPGIPVSRTPPLSRK